MKKVLTLILVFAMVLSFSACGKKETLVESKPDDSGSKVIHREQITVAVSKEPKTFVPYLSNDTGTSPVTHQIYDTLLVIDKDGKFAGSLAESWEQIDDTHYRFVIKEGIKFHNGNLLTAEDVLYSFEKNSQAPASKDTIGPVDIKNSKVVDSKTVEIALSAVYPAFLNCCTLDIAAIIDKETMEQVGEEGYNKAPVGTGAFKFVEWKSGDYIKFDANKEWWGGEINFDKLVLRYIPEAATRAIEAESGGVDIAQIAVTDCQNAENNPDTNVQITEILNTSFVSFNCSIEPFDNVKVRQAISLALNTDAIVKTSYLGYAEVAKSFVAPGIWGYSDQSGEYQKYDVEAAKKLLAEAGYPNGFETTLVSNGGQTVAEMIQAQLKEIGITVNLNVTDFSNWLDAITNGKQQMYIGGWTCPSADASEAFAYFDSTAFGPTNRSYYANEEADRLIGIINSETDTTKRMQACEDLQKLLAEECVTIGTNVGVTCFSVNSSIQGFVCEASQSCDFAHLTFTK